MVEIAKVLDNDTVQLVIEELTKNVNVFKVAKKYGLSIDVMSQILRSMSDDDKAKRNSLRGE